MLKVKLLESWTWPLDQYGNTGAVVHGHYCTEGGVTDETLQAEEDPKCRPHFPWIFRTNTWPTPNHFIIFTDQVPETSWNMFKTSWPSSTNASEMFKNSPHTTSTPLKIQTMQNLWNALTFCNVSNTKRWVPGGGGKHIYIYIFYIYASIYTHIISIYTHLYTYLRRLIYLHIIFNAKKAGTSGFHVCNWAIFFCQRGSRGALCESSPSKSYGISAQCALVERKRKTHIRWEMMKDVFVKDVVVGRFECIFYPKKIW